jgi:hypothetical protein
MGKVLGFSKHFSGFMLSLQFSKLPTIETNCEPPYTRGSVSLLSYVVLASAVNAARMASAALLTKRAPFLSNALS